MNKLFFAAALMLIGFASCTKNQVLNSTTSAASESNLPLSQIPSQVSSYIDNNYPDADITSAVTLKNSSAKTIVKLSTNEEVAFDSNHKCLGNGDNMHPNGNRHGRGHGGMGDGNGQGCGHRPGDISVDSLPSAITTYISSNYSGYWAMHAHKDSLCSVGAVISVMISDSSMNRLKLVFDASNNFIMSCTRIEYSTTPQAVQDSVATHFIGYTVRSRAEKQSLAAGTTNYQVFMKNGSTRKRVILDDTGVVVCEQ